jgi:hypothetical protein
VTSFLMRQTFVQLFCIYSSIVCNSYLFAFDWKIEALMDTTLISSRFDTLSNELLNLDSETSLDSLEAFDFWPYQVLMIILFSMITILSLGSKIVTIIVLLKSDDLPSKLWWFLINWSVADTVTSMFVIPFAYIGFTLGRWVLPLFTCPLLFIVDLLTQFVFVWTFTAISIDR